MPTSVRLPTKGFPKRTHLEDRYGLVARIGIPGGCPPTSSRLFPELREGGWEGGGGDKRQEGAQNFFTILRFGPGSALWKNRTNLLRLLFGSLKMFKNCRHRPLFLYLKNVGIM